MKIIKLSDKLHVTGTMSQEEFSDLNESCYKLIINNRVDGEKDYNLDTATESACCDNAGVAYMYMPVDWGTLSWEDIFNFNQAVNNSEGITLAHCRTATRSASLWLLGEILEGRLSEENLIEFGNTIDIDTSKALKWFRLNSLSVNKPEVEVFYESKSGSLQYLVIDPTTKRCAIIDPVLDFERNSATTSTIQADKILSRIEQRKLNLSWVLDTHPHADHFSAASYLKKRTGVKIGIGKRVEKVQNLWKGIYNISNFRKPSEIWDHLFDDNEIFYIGNLKVNVLFSPGHTLASVTYCIGDAAFIHDTLFMPDSGTARADFPGGSSSDLWNSICSILSLPDNTRLFTGHDYMPRGRELQFESTVLEQKSKNIHLHEFSEQTFVSIRDQRDKTLPLPNLMLTALQININGGELPPPESDGNSYLKIPLNKFKFVS
ncbi:beta-lactamase hydrolase domain-containing protein [Klebsiella michiganensis]|uniref:beta-lactamase hydrolase domain-containing protein n=1 Tax=Klebsiella michiganensis TaxID=1134687 RepID=UPI0025A14BE2|nr:sulfur transferase domain-containing protein [Klebsiella michiganensis]MDM6775968.1 sulfur transferase domain-containing protein [Klebsiella michiganensis]HDT0414669.1 MBL fold metallo-hydrolase [Klebsiella michiganensis]